MSTTRAKTHPNFREVVAPHPFTKGKNRIVFLSGPFDATPVTWQRAMTTALSHLDVTILNPQRLDWSSEWKEDPSFKPWAEQAKWELDGLEAADVIAIYFAPRMPQARTLMELGLWARSSKCVVGCSEGYPKKADVRVLCEKYGIEYVATVEELVATVKRKLDAQTSPSARADTGKAIQETPSMMNSIPESKEQRPFSREPNTYYSPVEKKDINTGNLSQKGENTALNIGQGSEDTVSAQGPENFPIQPRSHQKYSSQASTVLGTPSGRDNTINRFANQDSILLTDIKGREKERLQRGQSSLDLEAGNFSLEAPGDAAEHGGSDNLSGASSIFVLDNDPAVEKKWKPGVLAGYPMSAAFIVLDKDRGTALFKRFDEPSMRNLLYLQSRVACLAAKQEKFDKEDFASDNSSITRRLAELESRLPARLDVVPGPPSTFNFRVDHQEDWRRRVASAIDKMDKYGKPVALSHLRLDDLEGCISSRVQSPTDSMRKNLHLLAHYTEIFERSKGKDRERERDFDIHPRLEVRRDLPFRRRLGNLIFYIAHILDVLPGPLLLDLLNYVSADPIKAAIESATLEDILSLPLDEHRPGLDPPSLLIEIDHILTNLEFIFQDDLKGYLRDKLVPDAPYFAAKSWEDFEMFSRSYELMPKRQQEWEEEHPSKPWPFAKISEKWVEKMEQRWDLAMEMKQALKEYREHTGDTNLSNYILTDVDEALLLQQKLFKLAKPAGRTRKAVWKWYLTSYSDIQQFLGNSLVDLVGEDIVALRTAGEEDTVSNILSRYFAYFFLDKGISTRKVQFTSEKRISRVVTGVNMGAAIVSLVAAVWVLSKVNDYKTDKNVKVSKQELGWLTGFIVGFALWVGFMTRLPRKDVFGAIAVYAAVLVVFVGTGG